MHLMSGIATLTPSYASCTLLFGLMLGIAALTPTYGLDPQAALPNIAKPSTISAAVAGAGNMGSDPYCSLNHFGSRRRSGEHGV
jgi:hypothetical protein